MAIINNAHAGSQINLLCLIYRVLQRNPNKYDKDELFNICRPKSLFRKPEHEKRFKENLSFWQKENVQLWDIDENKKFYLLNSGIKVFDDSDIVKQVLNALFKVVDVDFMEPENKELASLYRVLALILSLPKLAPFGGELLNTKTLEDTLNTFFVDYQLNDSEKTPFLQYCHFLGFIAVEGVNASSIEYVVDPTVAIKGELDKLDWKDNKLPIKEFLSQLSALLPVLDGGVYKKNVEAYLSSKKGISFDSNSVSEALSHALARLNSMALIKFSSIADDANAMSLLLPNGVRSISNIEFNKGKSNVR